MGGVGGGGGCGGGGGVGVGGGGGSGGGGGGGGVGEGGGGAVDVTCRYITTSTIQVFAMFASVIVTLGSLALMLPVR